MFHDTLTKPAHKLQIGGVDVKFSLARKGTKVTTHTFHTTRVSKEQLGDYGYLLKSGHFLHQGNLLSDFRDHVSAADIAPRRQRMVTDFVDDIRVVNDFGLSLPNNCAFNALLAFLSPRLPNAYLVTRIARCRPSESCQYLCVNV